MPAWMTSLLREEVSVPIPSAASSTITSRPASASARATASPTTPAPTTTQSTLSMAAPSDQPPAAILPRFEPGRKRLPVPADHRAVGAHNRVLAEMPRQLHQAEQHQPERRELVRERDPAAPA